MNDNTITDQVVLDSVSAQIQQENQELPPLGSRWRSQNQRRYRKNNNNPQIQAINEEQNLGSDEIIETLHRRSIPGSGSSTSTPSNDGSGTNQASAGSPPYVTDPAHQGSVEDQEIFNTCNSGSDHDDMIEESKIQ